MSIIKLKLVHYKDVIIFIVMDNGNGQPARIAISENKDGKLLSQLEWPYVGLTI